jgi:hypothetical protein
LQRTTPLVRTSAPAHTCEQGLRIAEGISGVRGSAPVVRVAGGVAAGRVVGVVIVVDATGAGVDAVGVLLAA